MIELHWTGEQGEFCVTRPQVDGMTCQIIVPTSLGSGKPLALTAVYGVNDAAARLELLRTYGHQL